MGRLPLRIQRIFVCAALLAFGSGALAASQTAVDRPVRAFGTRVVVEGLGPVVYANGEQGIVALRLSNPEPFAVTAVVAGSRIEVPADAVLELDTFVGSVVVRSEDTLVVTSHLMDAESDALNTSTDVQRAARSFSVQANAVLGITTNSVACKYGTSYAYVEPVAGATYTWTTTGTNVSEGVGTNLVKLLHTGANTASVSVVVSVGGSSNTGSASITLRDAFRISELYPSSTSVTPGSPVTISWAIGANEIPRTQVLKINGTAVAIKTTDRSYTFTPSQLGSYSVELSASLVGGRRRAVRHGSSPIPAASFCGSDVRTTSFTIQDACIPASGSVSISGSSMEVGESTSVSITANGPWTASSTNGTLSRTSGNGSTTISFTATSAGTGSVTVDITSACGNVSRSDTIVVNPPCTPASGSVNISDSTMSVGDSTSVSITANGPWTASSTNGTLSQTSGSGNTTISFTATAAGTGSVALTVTSACGNASSSDTVTITVPAPVSVTLTSDAASLPLNGRTTLRAFISNAPDTSATTFVISSANGNSIAPTSGTGSGSKTFLYARNESGLADTVTITVTYNGQTASASVFIGSL